LTADEFRADLCRSRAAIKNASGQRVTSYRAPSFSITRDSLWALDVLAEEGFGCDSSLFPIRHDRYGMPGGPRFLHRRATSHGEIWEFPASTVRLGGATIPTAGGGYFRLYPWTLTRCMLESINRQGQPFMFYTHPWEIDPAQPRIGGIDRRSRFRHYTNLATTELKLKRLLATFRLGRLSDAIRQSSEEPQATAAAS
jgi:polysaccharide deacetylase family protein (PEP-CTERM system associated)